MAGILDEFVTVLGLQIEDDGLSGFQSSIGSTIGKMGILVAGTISAAAAISSLLNTAEETNSTAKFARGIDESFQAVQRLDFAAKRTGVSSGALEGLLGSLRTAALGAAAGLNDGFAEALGALGVSPIDEVTGRVKGVRDLLLEVAEAVKNAPNQDIALAFAGQAGIGNEFANFLRLGREGIQALGDEAQASGAILSDDAAASAERFREALDSLDRVVKSIIFENGSGLIGWAADGAEALLEFSRSEAFDALQGRFNEMTTSVKDAIKATGELFEEAAKELPEGALKDLSVAGVLGVLARRHPAIAAAIAIPAVASDIQKFRRGDPSFIGDDLGPGLENKFIEQPLDFFERLRRNFEDAARFQTESPLGASGFDRVAPGGGSGAFSGPMQFDIRHENHFQGEVNPRDVTRAIEEVNGDSLREAIEDARSQVVR